MTGEETFVVPRSRGHITNEELLEPIFQAMRPVLCSPVPLDNRLLLPLETAFASFVQRQHAYAVNSATAGLFLALGACGVKAGDEVITVGNSDISTTAAISHLGALPVLCDVREADFTMDPTKVEALITERTVALLPVDLYGYPADVRVLRQIADRHGLRIVEDAALAAGASDYGRPVGAFADVAVFSFGASKPLPCVGNGGIAVTDDPGIAARLQLLRSYGRPPKDAPGDTSVMEHVIEGYNLPLDPLEAAIISVKLPLLDGWTRRRQQIAELYRGGLAETSAVLPQLRPESGPAYHLYVIRVRERDRVYRALRERGVEAVLHYWPPVSHQPVYARGGLRGGDLPVTEMLAHEMICLPTAPELRDDEIWYVLDALRTALAYSAGQARDERFQGG